MSDVRRFQEYLSVKHIVHLFSCEFLLMEDRLFFWESDPHLGIIAENTIYAGGGYPNFYRNALIKASTYNPENIYPDSSRSKESVSLYIYDRLYCF